MSVLELPWQDLLTAAVLATAVGYLLVRVYRAAKLRSYGASCGSCPANPANRSRRALAQQCVVALCEVKPAPRQS